MRFGKILPIISLHNKLAGLRSPDQLHQQDLSLRLKSYLELSVSEALRPHKFILPLDQIQNLGDITYLKQVSERFAILAPYSQQNHTDWSQSAAAHAVQIIWQLTRLDDIYQLQPTAGQVFAGSSAFFKQAEMQLFILKQKGGKLWLLDSQDRHSQRLTDNLELDWLPNLSLNAQCNQTQADSAVTRTRLLRLLGLVVSDADTHEIEALFKQDSHLSYQLIKLVSSAAFAQTVEIQNFRQAIGLLGRSQLQRWLQLLLYTNPGANIPTINPLLPRAAFRARLMENLIGLTNVNRSALDLAYMVGIFSLLDELLAMPMSDLIQPLHLDKEVSEALLYKRGQLGRALSLVEECDDTQSSEIDVHADFVTSLSNQFRFDGCILDAYAWVAKICAEF